MLDILFAFRWSTRANLERWGGEQTSSWAARSFDLIENLHGADLDEVIRYNNSFHFLVWHVIELQAGMYLQQVSVAGCKPNCLLTVLSQQGLLSLVLMLLQPSPSRPSNLQKHLEKNKKNT